MEYVKINEEYLEAQISTEPEGLKFTIEGGNVEELANKCRDVTELEVTGEDKTVYGSYENLMFVSALVDADLNVTVTMKKKNDLEVEVEKLQQAVDEQAVAIADILYGGGEA